MSDILILSKFIESSLSVDPGTILSILIIESKFISFKLLLKNNETKPVSLLWISIKLSSITILSIEILVFARGVIKSTSHEGVSSSCLQELIIMKKNMINKIGFYMKNIKSIF